MRYELAMKTAREILEELQPACVQAEIAGGLRRGKADVHDIEIVAAPRMRNAGTNLFGEPLGEVSLLDEWLAEMVNWGTLAVGPKQGPRFKQLKVLSCGLMLDVFIVRPPAQWGVIYALRTGPAHYSHWLVTPRDRNGALPSDLRVARGAVWTGLARLERMQQDAAIENGRARLVETPTEESFFALLGLRMPEPGAREPQWGQRVWEVGDAQGDA